MSELRRSFSGGESAIKLVLHAAAMVPVKCDALHAEPASSLHLLDCSTKISCAVQKPLCPCPPLPWLLPLLP